MRLLVRVFLLSSMRITCFEEPSGKAHHPSGDRMPVLSLSTQCSQDAFLSILLKLSVQLFFQGCVRERPPVGPEQDVKLLPWQLSSGGTVLETSGDKLFPLRQVLYLLKKLHPKLMQEAADDRRSSTNWIASVSHTAKVNAVHCRSGDRLFAGCAGFERCSDKGAHKAIDKGCVKSPKISSSWMQLPKSATGRLLPSLKEAGPRRTRQGA